MDAVEGVRYAHAARQVVRGGIYSPRVGAKTMDATVQIETRVVEVSSVGTFFRRTWKAPGEEILRVEYLPVVYGEVAVMAKPADAPLASEVDA